LFGLPPGLPSEPAKKKAGKNFSQLVSNINTMKANENATASSVDGGVAPDSAPRGWEAREESARATTDDFFALGFHRSPHRSPEKRTDLIKPTNLPLPTNDLAGKKLDGTRLLPGAILNCHGDTVPLAELTHSASQYLAYLFVSDFSPAGANALFPGSPRARRRARLAELSGPPRSMASIAEAAQSNEFCNHLVRCLGGGPGCKARGMQIVALSCGETRTGTAQTSNLGGRRENGGSFTETIRRVRCFGVPAELSGVTESLRELYQVERVPCLVIVRKRDAVVMNSNACPWMIRDQHGNQFPWSIHEDVVDDVETVIVGFTPGSDSMSATYQTGSSATAASAAAAASYSETHSRPGGHGRTASQFEMNSVEYKEKRRERRAKRAAKYGIRMGGADASSAGRQNGMGFGSVSGSGATSVDGKSNTTTNNDKSTASGVASKTRAASPSSGFGPSAVIVRGGNYTGNTMMGLKSGGEVAARGRFELQEASLTKLRSIFHLLDKDMDGKLEQDQLLTAFAAVGIRPTRRIKYELAKRLPKKNNSGKAAGIGFDMFARIIRSTLIAQPTAVTEIDALTELFETKDKPGVIKGHELRHLLTGVQTSSRTELSSREADVLFDQLGIEEDGDVRLHEYVDTVGGDLIRVVDHRRLGDQGARSWMTKGRRKTVVRKIGD
jgi:Ca2+-binding EF-hand superfamily protein